MGPLKRLGLKGWTWLQVSEDCPQGVGSSQDTLPPGSVRSFSGESASGEQGEGGSFVHYVLNTHT